MEYILPAAALLFGAAIGSFLNVVIHRYPREESIVFPPSHCPQCNYAIKAYDNIPVLSYLILRGRCRNCGVPISPRYPLVEALSTLLALGVYARFVVGGDAPVELLAARFLVYFAFVGTLVVVAGVDLDHKIIPDTVTYPAIPAFFVAGILLRDVAPLDLLFGLVAGYGVVAVTAELAWWILKREGMGYGDAKLLALVGALLGWRAVVFTFLLAPFFGLFIVVPVLIARRKQIRGVEVPYGPFLVAGALVYVFFGRQLWLLLFPA